MINDDNNKITLKDEYNQLVEFLADENGDYYFTLLSTLKSNTYQFTIKEDHPYYYCFIHFIEQELDYLSDSKNNNPYFIASDNGLKLFDQNKPISDSEYIGFYLLGDEIRITFSKKFPSSIRITAVGRMDFYPFFIPVIDLFNEINQISDKNYNICVK